MIGLCLKISITIGTEPCYTTMLRTNIVKRTGFAQGTQHDVMRQAGKPGLLVSCFAAYTDLLVLVTSFFSVPPSLSVIQ